MHTMHSYSYYYIISTTSYESYLVVCIIVCIIRVVCIQLYR